MARKCLLYSWKDELPSLFSFLYPSLPPGPFTVPKDRLCVAFPDHPGQSNRLPPDLQLPALVAFTRNSYLKEFAIFSWACILISNRAYDFSD